MFKIIEDIGVAILRPSNLREWVLKILESPGLVFRETERRNHANTVCVYFVYSSFLRPFKIDCLFDVGFYLFMQEETYVCCQNHQVLEQSVLILNLFGQNCRNKSIAS